MIPPPPAAAIAAAVALCAAPVGARADDIATAEALFQEGRRLAEAGDYAAACPKFEESLRLDRGTGTLWHLANCLEKTGAVASAWARYRELVAEARKLGEPRKERAAAARAARLAPRLPRLVIEVPDGARVDGLVVERDGAEVGPGAWGTELPVDPGPHTIVARAPGHRSWQSDPIGASEGDTATVTVPPLEPAPPEPAGPIGMTVDEAIGRAETDPPPPWYEDTVGWALAGGGALLAVGGALSLSHAGSLEDDADAPGVDLDERDALLDEADTYRVTGATLAIVGGGALVAGAIKLALVPDRAEAVHTAAVPTRGGFAFTVAGRF